MKGDIPVAATEKVAVWKAETVRLAGCVVMVDPTTTVAGLEVTLPEPFVTVTV